MAACLRVAWSSMCCAAEVCEGGERPHVRLSGSTEYVVARPGVLVEGGIRSVSSFRLPISCVGVGILRAGAISIVGLHFSHMNGIEVSCSLKACISIDALKVAVCNSGWRATNLVV